MVRTIVRISSFLQDLTLHLRLHRVAFLEGVEPRIEYDGGQELLVAACFCDVSSIFDQEIQRCANYRDSGASDFRSSSGCALEAHFRHAVDEQGAESQPRMFCIYAAMYLCSRGLDSAGVSVRIMSALEGSSTKEGRSPYRERVCERIPA